MINTHNFEIVSFILFYFCILWTRVTFQEKTNIIQQSEYLQRK